MKATADVPVGAVNTSVIEVTREMTVAHHVEGMPEVYGTPIMIFHMESTAGELFHRYLPEGWLSVGVVVNVRHLSATPVGGRVTLRAEILEVNDNTVSFKVEAHDEFDKIGEGTHVRAAIETERFLKRVRAKVRKKD
jgi:predicted thioesterase